MPDGSAGDSRRVSWLPVVIVLSLGWLLLYATRTALSAALKDIGDYWGLSEGHLGFLASSFFMSYMALQIPSGVLADKFGSRRTLLAGFLIQAAGLVLGALSRDHIQFLLARVLTGAGQATYFACQQGIVSFAVPPERRTVGTAATCAGAGVGSAVGFVVGRVLSLGSLGWRMPFLVLGGLSVAYVLLVLATVEPRHPETRRLAEPRTREVAGGDGAPRAASGWNRLLWLSLAHFLSMYGFYVMLTWIPYYLETVRGITGGLLVGIPVVMPLIMAPAAVLWGILADRRGRRDFILHIALPAGALATAAIPLLRTPALLVVALAAYGATGKLIVDAPLVATVGESYPAEIRHLTLAAFNFAGAMAMVIAPSLTGIIAERSGSFDSGFYAAGLFNLAAYAAYLRAGRARRRPGRVFRPGTGSSLSSPTGGRATRAAPH